MNDPTLQAPCLALFGATGRTGGHLLREALSRGWAVRALARDPAQLSGHNDRLLVVPGNVRDPEAVAACLLGARAIVTALGTRRGQESDDMLAVAMRHVVDAAQASGIRRVLAIATAGLLDAPGGGLRRDAPGYPAAFRAGSGAHLAAFEHLRASDLEWTLVCPPDLVEGERAQPLNVQPDRLPDGPKRASMPALAAWLLDELEAGAFVRRRVGLNNRDAES
ncbi:MAG: NAD(P)H-binding protein [Candidatus Sericytochromatia bacterium]|nr:NAD(P)H-binding protein [Candidatus Sericytochromatia bacterium]